MRLQDKVVLVTGSTNGVGEAIATACVKQGASVMLHGRDEERAQALVAQLGKSRVAYVLHDLGGPNGVEAVVDETVKRFGRIDSLINNAGGSPRNTIDSITKEDFDWIIRLNLRTPLFLIQRAVTYFRKQHSKGTVVNIGSINAYCGQSDVLSYSISKGGLMTLTRNLANALGAEGIRINQINLGWTLTANESELKRREGFPTHWAQKVPKLYAPRGKLIQPKEVAQHVVFWASECSEPANGTVYELEQYPIIGRNLINEISPDVFFEDNQ